jgi:hypothetical protein
MLNLFLSQTILIHLVHNICDCICYLFLVNGVLLEQRTFLRNDQNSMVSFFAVSMNCFIATLLLDLRLLLITDSQNGLVCDTTLLFINSHVCWVVENQYSHYYLEAARYFKGTNTSNE